MKESFIEKLGIISGKLKVRETTDDSGDYIVRRYDLLNVFPWGCNGICYDIDNPNHARLFASSPEILEALLFTMMIASGEYELTDSENESYFEMLKMATKNATGRTWEEIKELIDYVK